MTRFTNSPLERLMQQVPRVQPVEPAAPIVLPHGHPCRGCRRYAEKCRPLQLPKNEIGFSRIKPDFNSLYLRMVLVARPDRITNRRAAVVSVDNAQSVNRGIDLTQFGINRGAVSASCCEHQFQEIR